MVRIVMVRISIGNRAECFMYNSNFRKALDCIMMQITSKLSQRHPGKEQRPAEILLCGSDGKLTAPRT